MSKNIRRDRRASIQSASHPSAVSASRIAAWTSARLTPKRACERSPKTACQCGVWRRRESRLSEMKSTISSKVRRTRARPGAFEFTGIGSKLNATIGWKPRTSGFVPQSTKANRMPTMKETRRCEPRLATEIRCRYRFSRLACAANRRRLRFLTDRRRRFILVLSRGLTDAPDARRETPNRRRLRVRSALVLRRCNDIRPWRA
jgi:hypothetical protein